MKNFRCLAVSIAGVLVATALATASPANAATGYTPHGGSNMNLVGSGVSFTVAALPFPQTITCPTFNLAGSIDAPGAGRPFSDNAGTISSLTSSGCTNPIMGPTTITPTGTWGVAITGPEIGPVSPATINNVEATIAMAGCVLDVASAGAVSGTFNDATQVFTPTGSTLEVTFMSGPLCPALGWAPGQAVTVAGSWTNTPPPSSAALTITNP